MPAKLANRLFFPFFRLPQQLGGYLTTADDIVQPFHLPRDLHQSDPMTMTTTSGFHLGGDDDRALLLVEDKHLLETSVSRDQLLVPTGDDDAGGEMEVEAEVDPEPVLRKGIPKTMRELAESHARQQEDGKIGTPPPQPPPQRDEDDLVMEESRGRGVPDVEEGPSRSGVEGPGRRTAKRRGGTKSGARTTRTSKKRTRRRRDSEDASDVDGEGEEAEEENTPSSKRRQLDAPVTPGAGSPAILPSTPNPNPSPNPGSGRVLRRRPQKSAAQLREERAMEEAYRRAVAG